MSDSSVPSFYVGAQNRGSTPGPYTCTAGTLLTELFPSHQFFTYLSLYQDGVVVIVKLSLILAMKVF